MEDIVLVGFGGHGKSVADCIERQGKYRIAGYIDINNHKNSYKYLGNDDCLKTVYSQGIRNAVVCIGYMGNEVIRQNLYTKLKQLGFFLPAIIDPSAIVSENATIGEGTFIGKLAVVNTDAKIGKMTIINTNATIEHECIVGDFSHIAVGAVLCGAVTIGDSCFIGANSTIIQSCTIGNNVVVGASTVVSKNLEKGILFRHKYENVLKTY